MFILQLLCDKSTSNVTCVLIIDIVLIRHTHESKKQQKSNIISIIEFKPSSSFAIANKSMKCT